MTARGSKLRVVVLRDPGFRLDGDATLGEVTAVLAEDPSLVVTEGAAGYGEAIRTLRSAEPDLVILDDVAGDPTAVVEQIDSAAPDLPIVVVLREDQAESAQACILAGARAFIFRPFEPSDLLEIVRRIHAKEERRRRLVAGPASAKGGCVIVVHGAKGGVGTTTLAVNLAVAARQLTRRRVALVDANLMGSDVGVALNITSDNSIADVVAHLRELDADLLHDTMVDHPSGVSVLPSPLQLERAEAISGDETGKVLAACRAHFDTVVVDTSSRLDEHVLAALDLADTVLLVSTPEIASLKNTARFLRLSGELGFGTEKMRLVVNRLGSPGAISPADIEENLRHKISYGLSSDGVPIIQSLNAGEPVVTLHPRSRAAREIQRLAATLLEPADAAVEPQPSAAKAPDRPWLKLFSRARSAPIEGAR